MVPMVWSVVTWPPVGIATSDICGRTSLDGIGGIVRGRCRWAVLICSAQSDPQSSINARDQSDDAKCQVKGATRPTGKLRTCPTWRDHRH